MSEQKQETVMGRLKESCVDAAMFKPFSLEDIDETVQRMLGKQSIRGGAPIKHGLKRERSSRWITS